MDFSRCKLPLLVLAPEHHQLMFQFYGIKCQKNLTGYLNRVSAIQSKPSVIASNPSLGFHFKFCHNDDLFESFNVSSCGWQISSRSFFWAVVAVVEVKRLVKTYLDG